MARALAGCFLVALAVTPRATESAIANGDTRTLNLSDDHTNESGSFTYMVNGSYDMAVLEKLNWFLRDWRINESVKMDPKLFDILWEVYRESGSTQPIDVLSAYRSPQTNSMLRRRSRLVAEHSQHMAGKAIDAHFVDVGPGAIRDIAMRMQSGGVGFYPIGITPWVHIDSGTVRYWPRMSRDALTRLFPDGKTVFIPADGQPMPGYDLARAEIESRGGDVMTASASNGLGLFSWLFGGPHGGGSDDADESGDGSASLIASNSMTHGRSGGGSYVAAADASGASNRGQPARAPAAPQPQPQAQPEPTVADVDASATSDANNEVTLRGPVAAQFIAPLPPHKPPDLVTVAMADTPMPPARPQDLPAPTVEEAAFSVASAGSRPVEMPPPPRPPEFVGPRNASPPPQGNRDLILALLRRGQVPDVITRGLKDVPRSALALTEIYAPDAPDHSEMMAKAATLAAPVPPPRPVDLTPTGAARTTRVTRSAAAGAAAAANPFGVIGAYAFARDAGGKEPRASTVAELLKTKSVEDER